MWGKQVSSLIREIKLQVLISTITTGFIRFKYFVTQRKTYNTYVSKKYRFKIEYKHIGKVGRYCTYKTGK